MSSLYDPASGLPREATVSSEEAARRLEERDARLDAINPFSKSYRGLQHQPQGKPRAIPEPIVEAYAPLPSRVPMGDTNRAPIAAPAPAPALRPKRRPTPAPTVKPLRTPQRSRKTPDKPVNTHDLVAVPGGWRDPETGDETTSAAMDLVVRLFVGQRKTVEEICEQTQISERFIRAILRHNRIPTIRNGRGPRVRPAAPRRTP